METSQLESAFMKADRAGDTAAASVLAAEIRRARSQTAPGAEPQYKGNADSGGVLGGIWQGVKDPFAGLNQIVARGANKIGLIQDAEVQNVDRMTKDEVGQYEADRKAAGRSGFDAARMTGNVVGAAPLMMVPGANTVTGAAALGAVSGALQPVTRGDFWSEKAEQAGIGALGGAAGGAIAKGASRLLSPQVSQNVRYLRDQGVDLTPGQIAGGMLKKAEDTATSIPVAGSMIDSAKRKSLESFNRAAINRGLGEIGVELPKGMVGREAIEFSGKKISDAYDQLLPQLTPQVDKPFINQVQMLASKASMELEESKATQFANILREKVGRQFGPGGQMTGEGFKLADSEIGRLARTFSGSSDGGQKQLGWALQDVQMAMRDMVARSNPALAPELSKINKAFATNLRVERAASSVGAQDGVFTPAQLTNAVKAFDSSGNKKAFARGDALLQDLADAGKSVLPSSVGDSGTAGRAGIMALLTGGAAYADPMTTGLAAGGIGAAYSKAGLKTIQSLLSAQRSPGTRTVAGILGRSGVPLSATGYPLLAD